MSRSKIVFSAFLSFLDHAAAQMKIIVATKRNAAPIIRTFNECVSPIAYLLALRGHNKAENSPLKSCLCVALRHHSACHDFSTDLNICSFIRIPVYGKFTKSSVSLMCVRGRLHAAPSESRTSQGSFRALADAGRSAVPLGRKYATHVAQIISTSRLTPLTVEAASTPARRE